MEIETLEEAAEKESKYLSDWEDKQTWVDGFIEGAKWQQEQDKNKYSEEEVLKLLIKFSDDRTFIKKNTVIHWFELNKK